MTTDVPSQFWSFAAGDLQQLLGSEHSGLTSLEAQKRSVEFSLNRMQQKPHSHTLLLLLNQFKSPIIVLLIAAAGLSFFLRDTTDAALILAIVLISGLLGFWQERGAADAVAKLMSMVEIKCVAMRDGKSVEIPSHDVVPGDIILVSAGDSIPGDCLIIESQTLFVDEASLTGETFPAPKSVGILPAFTDSSKRTNSLFMGTHVVSGSARALVCHTGRATEFGKISDKLKFRPPETEFEIGVRKFGYLLLEVTILLVVFIFASNVFLHRHVLDSFLFALALAVGLTPQLLPAIVSIVNPPHATPNTNLTDRFDLTFLKFFKFTKIYSNS